MEISSYCSSAFTEAMNSFLYTLCYYTIGGFVPSLSLFLLNPGRDELLFTDL